MKHTTINQTLTTLCIFITLKLSAQVIDRFPHVESFEGSAESSSWLLCPGTSCMTLGNLYPFSLVDNLNESYDGLGYAKSHSYTY